jgi:hypothetical protein
MWLPTVAYQLFNILHHRLPNHRALFADFNHLDGAIPGMIFSLAVIITPLSTSVLQLHR